MAKKTLRERLADKRESMKKGAGGFNYLLIKEGQLRVRHLFVGQEKDWSIEATTFYLGKAGTVISPATLGMKCAIMRAYEKFKDSKDPEEKVIAKRMKPGRKYLSPVIAYKDLKGEELDLETGPKLLMLAAGVASQAVDLFLDEDEAGDFTDPIKGYDLKYKRTGKGKNDTEYSVVACRPTKLKDQSLRKQVFDPEEMLKAILPTYEETKKKLDEFLNLDPEEDDDDQPRKKSSDKKKKKKSKDL
jgi:hypothetical protein